jgi:peptide/nickel transport system permease protein
MATTETTETTGTASRAVEPASLRDRGTYFQPPWRRTVRRFLRHRMAITGTLILLALFAYIFAGSLIFSEADANYNDTSILLNGPSVQHPFGTDTVGRDVLARTIYGGQISIIIGVLSVLVSVSLGTLVGALSGYYGGMLDTALMRVTEAMLSIPTLLLLLVLAKFFSDKVSDINLLGRTFSGSLVVIIAVIGLTSWMYLARIVRSSFLSIKQQEYITAAQAAGASNSWIIRVHILPNAMAPIIVTATLGVASAILQEAYVSFLGMGVRPPTASWGNMLDSAYKYVEQAPWLWIFPGLLVILTVMSINFIGDGLRDALDPQSDKKL